MIAIFLLPALILFIGVLIAPIIMSVVYSLFDMKSISLKGAEFVLFGNYKEFFTSVSIYIWRALGNAMLLALLSVFIQLPMSLGLALMLVIQATFNMMVAVGLAPVTGQPLPLISKGGTSTIINCAYIGAILSVSRSAKVKKGKEKALNEA